MEIINNKQRAFCRDIICKKHQRKKCKFEGCELFVCVQCSIIIKNKVYCIDCGLIKIINDNLEDFFDCVL